MTEFENLQDKYRSMYLEWQSDLFRESDVITLEEFEKYKHRDAIWISGTGSFLNKKGRVIDCVQGEGERDKDRYWWNMDDVVFMDNQPLGAIDASTYILFLDEIPDPQLQRGDVVYATPDVHWSISAPPQKHLGIVLDIFEGYFGMPAAEVLMGTEKRQMYAYKIEKTND